MPREIAHCYIATTALFKVDSLAAILNKNSSLKSSFLLGAITPDSAYYNLALLKKGNLYADLLHGIGSHDSFDFIKKIINPEDFSTDMHLAFFFLGVISHILLDSYWHPFIFKVTGDYNHSNLIERADARARHRRLETLIDQLMIVDLNLDIKNFKINSFISQFDQSSLKETNTKLTSLLNANNSTMIKTWKWHANLQDIFTGNFGNKIKNSPLIKREIRSLFNSDNLTELKKAKHIVEYHNELIFNEWITDSITKLSLVFIQYERNPKEFILNYIGPSAVTGQIGIEDLQFEYDLEKELLEGY